jgi:hypothetical protein
MKNIAALFATLGVLSAAVAFADPPKTNQPSKPAKPAPKLVDTWHCPIAGEAIANHKNPEKGVVVANKYRVHFCCGGCPEEFSKLSDKEKLAKAEAAYKKDQADAPKPAAPTTPKKG